MLNSVTFHLSMDVHKTSLRSPCSAAPRASPRASSVCLTSRASALRSEEAQAPSRSARARRFTAGLRRSEWRGLRAAPSAHGLGGYHCDLAAPSLGPTRPGDQRKHDRIDAIRRTTLSQRRTHADHVPEAPDEQVRDLVRCRETFQREILRSRHYVLKLLRRRGLVHRGRSNWTRKRREWLNAVASASADLPSEDRVVLAEYLVLHDYKVGRRQALDRRSRRLLSRYVVAGSSVESPMLRYRGPVERQYELRAPPPDAMLDCTRDSEIIIHLRAKVIPALVASSPAAKSSTIHFDAYLSLVASIRKTPARANASPAL
jgi:hypothetical protein